MFIDERARFCDRKAVSLNGTRSRLDYGNVLLYGLPDNLSERLQKVQNVAASVITRHPNGITSLNTGSVQAPLVTDKRTNFVL